MLEIGKPVYNLEIGKRYCYTEPVNEHFPQKTRKVEYFRVIERAKSNPNPNFKDKGEDYYVVQSETKDGKKGFYASSLFAANSVLVEG